MPGIEMHNQSHNQPHPDDREAAMARADLYKLANYSMKLFKMIRDGDELEGWVQAKVTKAADYVASVYHYMEYEMKFSEYGDKLENSDMYSEAVRNQFTAKLMEAKTKLDKLKKMNEEDLKKTGDTKKTSKGGTVTKTDKGIKHERDPKSYSDEDGDEKSGKGTKSHAKSQSAAEKKAKAPAQKPSPKSAKTWGMKDSAKFDNRDKEVKEGAKPDFLDMDKDGDKKEPMKKAVADKKGGKPQKGVNPFAKKTDESKMMPKGKKRPVKESVETKLSFKQMVQLVQESGGQQQIDAVDKALFTWAERVAKNKLGEGMKADLYAGLVYERNGGVFEMYDVLSEAQK